MIIHNDVWYSTVMQYDEENKRDVLALQIADMKTGEVSTVWNTDFDFQSLCFIKDDRIYFNDYKSLFSTNLKLEDKIVHLEGEFAGWNFVTDGEYVYAGIPGFAEPEYDAYGNETRTQTHSLIRYDINTGESTDLGITTYIRWLMTEKYIYYYPIEYSGIKGTGRYNRSSIWRCKHDGSEKEKVFDLYRYEEGTELPNIIIHLSTAVVIADDVLYAKFAIWEDLNKNGHFDVEKEFTSYAKIGENFGIIKIDMTTNTYEIIYPMQ